ncbi:MAG: porin family protein [Candidatus Aminicenantes bacterium]|nr:porin family protein [Candidatus Aminicenantes bacterium]
MNQRFLGMSLCALFFLLTAALPARGGFYIGVQSGLSNQKVSAGKIAFDKDSSFLYGAQAGLRFLSLAVEGQFYRAAHSLLSDDPQLILYDGRGMYYYYLGVNAKVGFPLLVVYPYLTAGYGRYSASIRQIGKSTDQSFNVGAGAELALGKIGIFAELRYVDFGVEISGLTWDFGGLNFHCGLNYHF